MNTSSSTTTPAASPEVATSSDTTGERNWAPFIRRELEAVGFKLVQMPEQLTRDQGEAMLLDLKSQLQELAGKA